MNGLLLQQADKVLALYQSQQPAMEPLQAFDGQTLSLQLTDLNIQLLFRVEQRIRLLSHSDSIECAIRCKSSLLPKLKHSSMLPELIKSGELELEGELQLASRIADALAQTQFDSEEWLSQYMGDVPAHLLHKGLQKLRDWACFRGNEIRQDMIEWLQDEIRLLPMAAEQTIQSRAIARLEMQTEALAQRIERLKCNL